MGYSLTYSGVIVMILGFIFRAANIPFVPENLQATADTVIALVGALMALIGRYRLGGINKAGVKTK